MKVHIYKDGQWLYGLFDARNVIKVELIEGDLYWSAIGLTNYVITSYKNLTVTGSTTFKTEFDLVYNNYKTAAQKELNRFLLECGSRQTVTITDAMITKGWLPYYEVGSFRSTFSIFITPGLYENAYEYHNYVFIYNRSYLGQELYSTGRHLSRDDVVYVNDEHVDVDTDIIYGVDRKYKILSTTMRTYYKLVDIVNDKTYDLTPFVALFVTLFNELFGTIIVITEINPDTLYIYIEEAEFIFTKSKNNLVAINQGVFYAANHQLTKMPKKTADKVIKAIKDKWGS